PTAPSNLLAVAASATQINLSWTTATDNVGVTNYLMERQDPGSSSYVQVATTTGTIFSDAGLSPSSTYSYRVRAADAAGNLGSYCIPTTGTTQDLDTQPPTAPTNLSAMAAGGTHINLSWTPATDNVGVTAYLLERQDPVTFVWGQIATPTTT